MQNILITGNPRVGKTTLINNIISQLKKSVTGFVTNEIKEGGRRIGFSIKTLSGLEVPLASKYNETSNYRVANYGIYLENINKIVAELEKEIEKSSYDLIIIDEIGKMELFSSSFKKFLNSCLEKQQVLGTIMLKDNDYTLNIKNRSDTKIFYLTINNRDTIKEKIIAELSQCLKDQK